MKPRGALLTSRFLSCAELILHIRKEVEKGKLPADVAANLEELYYNYKDAVTFLLFYLLQLQLDHRLIWPRGYSALSGYAEQGSKCTRHRAFKHGGPVRLCSARCRGSTSCHYLPDFL